ncbi:hypothetical protein NKI09_07115 [Mesorhizobium sp. M0757]|uniref:hypothetical protein n=1 Tax=Mesorhizobium sp. M0757 TaxID=2956993 RepID=UPI00333B3A06
MNGSAADTAQLPATRTESLPTVISAVVDNYEIWAMTLQWHGLNVGMQIADVLLDAQPDFRDTFHAYLRHSVAKDRGTAEEVPPVDYLYEHGLNLPLIEDEVWRGYVEVIRRRGGRGNHRTAQEIEAGQVLEMWLAALPEKIAAEHTRLYDPMRSLHREVGTFVFKMVSMFAIPGHIDEFAVLSRVRQASRSLSNSKTYKNEYTGGIETLPAHEVIDMDKIITESARRAHREHEKDVTRRSKRGERVKADQADEPVGSAVQLLRVEVRGNMRTATTQHGTIEIPRKRLEGFKKFRDDFAEQFGIYYDYIHYDAWDRMVAKATNSSLLEFSTTTTVGGDRIGDFAAEPGDDA